MGENLKHYPIFYNIALIIFIYIEGKQPLHICF